MSRSITSRGVDAPPLTKRITSGSPSSSTRRSASAGVNRRSSTRSVSRNTCIAPSCRAERSIALILPDDPEGEARPLWRGGVGEHERVGPVGGAAAPLAHLVLLLDPNLAVGADDRVLELG